MPTPSIVAVASALTVQTSGEAQAGKSRRPHAFGGKPPAISSQVPWTHRGARSGAQVSTPGHDGYAGHIRAASCDARSPYGTAVSAPPWWQPQQSSRTRAQSASTVQLGFVGAAASQVRQPLLSIA